MAGRKRYDEHQKRAKIQFSNPQMGANTMLSKDSMPRVYNTNNTQTHTHAHNLKYMSSSYLAYCHSVEWASFPIFPLCRQISSQSYIDITKSTAYQLSMQTRRRMREKTGNGKNPQISHIILILCTACVLFASAVVFVV